MKLSLIAAMAKNRVIGNGMNIPWKVYGEQLLFKALTYNQWILVGRKTFESMGILENRKYAVVTRSRFIHENENVKVFNSVDVALNEMSKITNHLIVSGGGQIYNELIDKVNTLHISVVDVEHDGDIYFPQIPEDFKLVFQQDFESNLNYSYQIWQRN